MGNRVNLSLSPQQLAMLFCIDALRNKFIEIVEQSDSDIMVVSAGGETTIRDIIESLNQEGKKAFLNRLPAQVAEQEQHFVALAFSSPDKRLIQNITAKLMPLFTDLKDEIPDADAHFEIKP